MTDPETELDPVREAHEPIQSDLPPPPMSMASWVERVHALHAGWLPVEDRPRLLRVVAEALVDARSDLAAEAAKVLGVHPGEFVLHELTPLVAALHRASHELRLGVRDPHHEALTTVIAAPSNALLALPMAAAFRAFARGSAVAVVAQTPMAGLLRQVAEVARKAGVPHGGVAVLNAELSSNLALTLQDVGVSRALWLGAPRQARGFQAQCIADGIEAFALPYGASTAVVFDDADLDRTAQAILASRVCLGGQRRDAIQRVVVSAVVHDALASRLATRAESIVNDRWVKESLTRMDGARRELLRTHFANAHHHGGALITGEAPPATGLVTPILVTDEGEAPSLLGEWVPAPLLGLLRVDDPASIAKTVKATLPGSVVSFFGGTREAHAALGAKLGVPLVLVNDAVDAGIEMLDLALATAAEGSAVRLREAAPKATTATWAPYSLWTQQTVFWSLFARHGKHGFGGPLGELF